MILVAVFKDGVSIGVGCGVGGGANHYYFIGFLLLVFGCSFLERMGLSFCEEYTAIVHKLEKDSFSHFKL